MNAILFMMQIPQFQNLCLATSQTQTAPASKPMISTQLTGLPIMSPRTRSIGLLPRLSLTLKWKGTLFSEGAQETDSSPRVSPRG